MCFLTDENNQNGIQIFIKKKWKSSKQSFDNQTIKLFITISTNENNKYK